MSDPPQATSGVPRAPAEEAATGAPGRTTDDTVALDADGLDRSRALSATVESPPAEVPGYRITRKLGEGGYGSVWLARERNTGKQVAIKFYSHRRGVDWSLLNREVEKLAVLYTSRNIVGLLEVGWDSDPPYYVMEFLENGSLAGLLAAGPPSVAESLRITRQILHALVNAHGAGILHCDLKPANVLLDPELEPRICDFGQSRLTDEQTPSLGTLFYMAPEQAGENAVPDARWDVYAVGALLYHMLVGHPPGRTAENECRIRETDTLADRLATYRAILAETPRPAEHRKRPGVDRRLADVVDRCLEHDPSRRFPNAQSVLDAIGQRDRSRARRPLMLLGLLGPALLLLAMAPIMTAAMRNAVDTAEEHLTDRALESDSLSASILSRSLERDLQDRMAELERYAVDGELRAAILAAHAAGWEDRDTVRAVLDERKAAVDARRTAQDRKLDTSWFLTDARGTQRWRQPFSRETDLENFTWRDYFHGLGRELPQDTPEGSLPPITSPHLSAAFRSQATLRFMVAWSVPVKDDAGNVVAVLARTTHLDQLLADYDFSTADVHAGKSTDSGDTTSSAIPATPNGNGHVDRIVALVDGRDWKFLNHEWMSTPEFRALPVATREGLVLPEVYHERLKSLVDRGHAAPGLAAEPTPAPINDYVDRFGEFEPEQYGGEWLAAFAPVGDTGWITVIQERRRGALQPIAEMRGDLLRYGLTAAAVACGLIGLLWYFVSRALAERSGGQ